MISDVAEASTHKVTLEVTNPIAITEIETVQPAARVADLSNKRIGLYWNRKTRLRSYSKDDSPDWSSPVLRPREEIYHFPLRKSRR